MKHAKGALLGAPSCGKTRICGYHYSIAKTILRVNLLAVYK